MSRILGRRFHTLSEIYSVLPEIDCTGRCAGTCTFIPMSNVERQRLATRGFHVPKINARVMSWVVDPENNSLPDQLADTRCPALTADRRCAAHEIRPLICRLYGVCADMVCPFGCKVHGDILSVDEAHYLLDRASQIGNGSTFVGGRYDKKVKKHYDKKVKKRKRKG